MVGIEVYTNKKTSSENVAGRIPDLAERISKSDLLVTSSLMSAAGSDSGRGGALLSASLNSAIGRKGRHLSGTFCLNGDTMEGIIQCLVFLKAFSVSTGSGGGRCCCRC
ncbi:UNVERIFIED_CONTAM: hypothetical protein PYX00_005701 [Menopon gallinae]|uniref:Uncharacterized protein n=1 Tax=Menopon gallinae TaxID=328185 RepID=A0AAW2HT87_9NEOP